MTKYNKILCRFGNNRGIYTYSKGFPDCSNGSSILEMSRKVAYNLSHLLYYLKKNS